MGVTRRYSVPAPAPGRGWQVFRCTRADTPVCAVTKVNKVLASRHGGGSHSSHAVHSTQSVHSAIGCQRAAGLRAPSLLAYVSIYGAHA